MLATTTLNPEEAKAWGLGHDIKSELFEIGSEVISRFREKVRANFTKMETVLSNEEKYIGTAVADREDAHIGGNTEGICRFRPFWSRAIFLHTQNTPFAGR
jgi:hypothetical protein